MVNLGQVLLLDLTSVDSASDLSLGANGRVTVMNALLMERQWIRAGNLAG